MVKKGDLHKGSLIKKEKPQPKKNSKDKTPVASASLPAPKTVKKEQNRIIAPATPEKEQESEKPSQKFNPPLETRLDTDPAKTAATPRIIYTSRRDNLPEDKELASGEAVQYDPANPGNNTYTATRQYSARQETSPGTPEQRNYQTTVENAYRNNTQEQNLENQFILEKREKDLQTERNIAMQMDPRYETKERRYTPPKQERAESTTKKKLPWE